MKTVNQSRLAIFIVLLIIGLLLTVLFPISRETHSHIQVYEFGWVSVFLTIRDFRGSPIIRRGLPIQFSFDTLALAINVLFVWFVAWGVHMLYTTVMGYIGQNKRPGSPSCDRQQTHS